MKNLLRSVIRRATPGLYRHISSARARKHSAEVRRRMSKIEAQILARGGNDVCGGPFRGMQYLSTAACSALLPKLLGCYEREIEPWVRAQLATEYDVMVDVGCAEGYYAVGFARFGRARRVIAYDIDPRARKLCNELAEKNGVSDKVEVRGECTHASLAEDATGRCLIICDCEGFEAELLDPEKCPPLRTADILVELHDFAVKDVADLVLPRFAATHTIQRTPAVRFDGSSIEALSDLTPQDRCDAVSEWRPPGMEWALLQARR